MENSTLPDHEKLFDEICGKLSELSQTPHDSSQQRLESMQNQIKRSQEELKAAQFEIEEKIRSLDNLSFASSDLTREVKRVSEQLEQERMNNSKLSTDLAKSLELNLKLQFEIEEVRSKAALSFGEERKLNQLLTEKNKNVSHELDLSQALCNETRLELAKAKDKFQQESTSFQQEKRNLETLIADQNQALDEKKAYIEALQGDMAAKSEEIQQLSGSLQEFENHTLHQHEMMKNLSNVAEKKMIELKLALDKRTIESQDYYSHLQQAMTQINVLRQENAALKDYISKLTALHQHKAAAQTAAP